MRNTNFLYNLILFSFIAIVSIACSSSGSSDGNAPETNTYSTTSTKGDYSEWTLVGGELSAIWQVVADNGDIKYTYNITATCGDADINGVRACTVSSGSCTPGVLACIDTPTGNFDMMDVPGVALFVQMDGDFGDEQLHIGFVKNALACADDVSGDYTFIRSGLGLDENFGMYRSDANFINILHSDFGFDAASAATTPTIIYKTGSEAESLADGGCVDGVRTRTASGDVMRSMITNSGLFILDLPSGQGGLLSFKTSNAASITDFANKNFGGISFPDNANPEAINATSGTVNANKVTFAANVGGEAQSIKMMALNIADTTTDPAYPDFSLAPSGYNASTMFATYPSPSDIPGLFKFEGFTDTGRVIMIAMKFNNKLIGIGMVYNFRNTGDTNPATGNPFTTDGLYNTGNFILFEK